MPIYAYQCAACGAHHEALQKVSDAPLTECPACHKRELVKQVTAAGFQLKGSGWYVTDFRDKGAAKKPAEAKGDAPAEGGKDAGAGTATDAAPAGGKASDTAAPAPAASSPSPSPSPSPPPASGK